MFVSAGNDAENPTEGAIWRYNLTSLSQLITGAPAPTLLASTYGAVGMAIQPGTGDLYVASCTDFNNAGMQTSGNGGIIGFTAASGFAPASSTT